MTPRDAKLAAEWQRDNAFEEAAKLCEVLFATHYPHSQRRVGAEMCAKAIRELKASPSAAYGTGITKEGK